MKKNKKILFILPTDSIGGAERVVKNIILEMLNYDFTIDLIFLSRGDNGNWKDTSSYLNFNRIYLDARSESRSLVKLLKHLITHRVQYDFIYTTHTHVNALSATLMKMRIIDSKKHIARESTVIFDRFFGIKRLIMRALYFLYRDIDVLVFQTQYMKKRLLEEIPRLRELNPKVIRNPINIKYIDDKLKEIDFESTTKYEVVFVGRLIGIKNISLILYSLKDLVSLTKDFNFTIVGSGEDEAKLRDLTRVLDIENYVSFVGNVDNPYEYMKKADLGVVSSLKEGFPNVIIEMMASGTKNILTTPCAGDLDTLPNLKILKGFSREEMSKSIIDEWKSRADNRHIYREYAQSINVDKFIEKIYKDFR